jgi:hypothetical protein
LPVVGKQAADINARAAYFLKMIELLTGSSAFNHLGLQYHSNVHNVLAHVYFAMSEAYKSKFLNPGKRTDPTKQAALTCAAICAVNPLRPLPTEAVHEEHLYINQMLAMRCACTIIEHPIHERSFDEQRRIYLQMQRFVFPSIQPLLDEAAKNNGEIKSEVAIKLTPPEEASLTGLVALFVAYRGIGA